LLFSSTAIFAEHGLKLAVLMTKELVASVFSVVSQRFMGKISQWRLP
jgi:hypothetical protein